MRLEEMAWLRRKHSFLLGFLVSYMPLARCAFWSSFTRRSRAQLAASRALTRMASSSFMALPDDVLQRVLVGVLLDDHPATAAACRAFRDVIRGPRFHRLRREYGFAERGIILVGCTHFHEHPFSGTGPMGIHIAGKHRTFVNQPVLAIIPSSERDYLSVDLCGSTTDGGARLFLTMQHPGPKSMSLAFPELASRTVFAVDGTTRRWSRFATLPLDHRSHCLEWHNGLLYVAGGLGYVGNKPNCCLNTLHSFNETTGLWEDLPPMPHACSLAASGVIGNELFVAGGRGVSYEDLSTLQIYDFTTRAWRLGAPLPYRRCGARGIVVDGKLYLVSTKLSHYEAYQGQSSTMVYDVQSNTWSQLLDPGIGRRDHGAMHAFAHEGRIVAVDSSGNAKYRGTGTDPTNDVFWPPDWRDFDLNMARPIIHGVAGSVILG